MIDPAGRYSSAVFVVEDGLEGRDDLVIVNGWVRLQKKKGLTYANTTNVEEEYPWLTTSGLGWHVEGFPKEDVCFIVFGPHSRHVSMISLVYQGTRNSLSRSRGRRRLYMVSEARIVLVEEEVVE